VVLMWHSWFRVTLAADIVVSRGLAIAFGYHPAVLRRTRSAGEDLHSNVGGSLVSGQMLGINPSTVASEQSPNRYHSNASTVNAPLVSAASSTDEPTMLFNVSSRLPSDPIVQVIQPTGMHTGGESQMQGHGRVVVALPGPATATLDSSGGTILGLSHRPEPVLNAQMLPALAPVQRSSEKASRPSLPYVGFDERRQAASVIVVTPLPPITGAVLPRHAMAPVATVQPMQAGAGVQLEQPPQQKHRAQEQQWRQQQQHLQQEQHQQQHHRWEQQPQFLQQRQQKRLQLMELQRFQKQRLQKQQQRQQQQQQRHQQQQQLQERKLPLQQQRWPTAVDVVVSVGPASTISNRVVTLDTTLPLMVTQPPENTSLSTTLLPSSTLAAVAPRPRKDGSDSSFLNIILMLIIAALAVAGGLSVYTYRRRLLMAQLALENRTALGESPTSSLGRRGRNSIERHSSMRRSLSRSSSLSNNPFSPQSTGGSESNAPQSANPARRMRSVRRTSSEGPPRRKLREENTDPTATTSTTRGSNGSGSEVPDLADADDAAF